MNVKCTLFLIPKDLDISGKCCLGDLGSTSVSGINMATPQLKYGFRTTCQNTCWRLQRFDWKSWFLSPEVEGTESILSLRRQLKNEKVGRCQCAWRHSENVIADITLVAVFLYPAPAHKWRRAHVLIFWRKGVELGSNSVRSICGFLSSVFGQLCTQVSFLSFRHLWR